MPFFSNVKTIISLQNEFFNLQDTLSCGQIFRYKPYKEGFLVFSKDKACYAFEDNATVYIESEYPTYFENFFDLKKDYSKIVQSAVKEDILVLTKSALLGKGIRILKQAKEEMLFSFIISQNNNIKRIQSIIEKLCDFLGEKFTFDGEEYSSFPTVDKLAKMPIEFYKKIGLGYRAEYIKLTAERLVNKEIDLNLLESYNTTKLKAELLKIKGVGEKVANCITLFGFNRTDSFPVDTWIEKVYKEDMQGELKDRKKITEYYLNRFKENAGYYQQYLFYYKRSKEERR